MIPPAHPNTLAEMGEGSGRLARGMHQLRRASATWTLLGILAAIQLVPFLLELAGISAGTVHLAQQTLGLSATTYLSGSPWQPLTYGLIHADLFHLTANAACILLLGPKLEHIIPKGAFWFVTLFSAFAGGALFLVFSPSSVTPSQTLVGSSGICFGFLILLTTLSPDSRFMPFFISGRTIGLAIIIANLALTLMNPDLPTGFLSHWGRVLDDSELQGLFQVSHACHLGGSLVGLLYGRYLLRPRVTIASLKRAREKREAAARIRK